MKVSDLHLIKKCEKYELIIFLWAGESLAEWVSLINKQFRRWKILKNVIFVFGGSLICPRPLSEQRVTAVSLTGCGSRPGPPPASCDQNEVGLPPPGSLSLTVARTKQLRLYRLHWIQRISPVDWSHLWTPCIVLLGRLWVVVASDSFFKPVLTRGCTWLYGVRLGAVNSCCLDTRRRCFSCSFSICSVRTLSCSSSIISSISTSRTLDASWPAPPAASCSMRLRSFTSRISLVPSLTAKRERRIRTRVVCFLNVCVSHFLILSSCLCICCLRWRFSSCRRRNRSSSSSLGTRETSVDSCRVRAL